MSVGKRIIGGLREFAEQLESERMKEQEYIEAKAQALRKAYLQAGGVGVGKWENRSETVKSVWRTVVQAADDFDAEHGRQAVEMSEDAQAIAKAREILSKLGVGCTAHLRLMGHKYGDCLVKDAKGETIAVWLGHMNYLLESVLETERQLNKLSTENKARQGVLAWWTPERVRYAAFTLNHTGPTTPAVAFTSAQFATAKHWSSCCDFKDAPSLTEAEAERLLAANPQIQPVQGGWAVLPRGLLRLEVAE